MNNLTNIYHDLTAIKSLELENCNHELNNNHNKTIKKALMVYRTELLECLEMYNRYLDK